MLPSQSPPPPPPPQKKITMRKNTILEGNLFSATVCLLSSKYIPWFKFPVRLKGV